MNEETIREARMRYDAERFYRVTRDPHLREQKNARALRDVARDMELDAKELAGALGIELKV